MMIVEQRIVKEEDSDYIVLQMLRSRLTEQPENTVTVTDSKTGKLLLDVAKNNTVYMTREFLEKILVYLI